MGMGRAFREADRYESLTGRRSTPDISLLRTVGEARKGNNQPPTPEQIASWELERKYAVQLQAQTTLYLTEQGYINTGMGPNLIYFSRDPHPFAQQDFSILFDFTEKGVEVMVDETELIFVKEQITSGAALEEIKNCVNAILSHPKPDAQPAPGPGM